MRPPSLKSRILRLVGGFLAAAGLLGHGLAMLLVALLAQAPASADDGFAGYGAICTADGGPAETNEPAPPHPSGHIDACPVCTAFAQHGVADLPQALQLPGRQAADAARRPAQESLPAAAHRRTIRSRGPPAVT
jgi:hypothetical protein